MRRGNLSISLVARFSGNDKELGKFTHDASLSYWSRFCSILLTLPAKPAVRPLQSFRKKSPLAWH